ncbi:MAG: 50S ribosomal protein L10 [Christensenellaceae bacterium]|jgi:large subunit ribosomal protein L10|nr:50S ribosomal protein L10 [Christensenellaceae bacterium]
MANIDAKKVVVEEIKQHLKKSKSVIFVDYKGINVEQDTTLRKKLRDSGAAYKVYKNRLVMRALDEAGIKDYDVKLLEGTTSVVFGSDETTAAGILYKAGKEYQKLGIKFGILNGTVLSSAETEALAKIPSKEVLIAQLLGMLNAPIAALARALDAVAKKGA